MVSMSKLFRRIFDKNSSLRSPKNKEARVLRNYKVEKPFILISFEGNLDHNYTIVHLFPISYYSKTQKVLEQCLNIGKVSKNVLLKCSRWQK